MSKQEQINLMEEELPPWMPRTGDVGELIAPAAGAVDEQFSEITDVENSLFVDTADSKEELETISSPFGVKTTPSESLQQFQRSVKLSFRQISNSGHPQQILEAVSNILELSIESIRLERKDGCLFVLKIPGGVLEEDTSQDEIQELLSRIAASTYELELIQTGTLEYVTPEEYNTGSYDSTNGYGTPTEHDDDSDGGTYSDKYA